MKILLNWKNKSFSSTNQIFLGDELLGELKNHSFKQTAEGHLGQKSYRFETKGLFKQETRIIDGKSDVLIGNISYNSMMTKATIQLKGRSIYWKYDNTWQTRWSLGDDQGTLMKFSGGMIKGTIACEEIDELLLLCGMFVTNYYQQATIAIMVAIFIPIWFTVIN